MAEPPTFEDAHDNNCTLKTKTLSSGPIKVNMKFSLSFLGVSFSSLFFWVSELKFTLYFNFRVFRMSQQLLIIRFWFPTRLSSQIQGFELFFSLKYCSQDQQSKIWVIFLGFQKPGFPFPLSNPTDIP